LIDMYSNQDIFKLDLNVYWKNKLGDLIPSTIRAWMLCKCENFI
jgi:hypothetical protein